MQKNNKAFIEVTLIMCAILAAICISAGVISLLAHNWDEFPKGVRVMLSFIPIAAGISVFYKAFFHHRGSKVWMESSATFLVLMTGSSIALVTQIYHIGHFNNILLVWMLLSLPVLYLAHSSAVSIVYLAGITFWLMAQHSELLGWYFRGSRGSHALEIFGYWMLILAVVPHFYKFYKSGIPTLRTQILGWFSIVIVLYGANLGFTLHHTVGYSFAIASAYVLGKMLFPHGEFFWNRPFQTVALIATLALAFFLSNSWYLYYTMSSNQYVQMDYYGDYGPRVYGNTGLLSLNYVLLAAFAFFIIFFFARDQAREKRMNPFMTFLPFVVIVGLLLAYSQRNQGGSWWSAMNGSYLYARIWFNLYLLAFCAWYVYKGIAMRIPGIVTLGVGMFSLLLLVRYMDSHIDFYLKGVIYIGIGAGLLFFNKYYTAKALAKENEDKNFNEHTPIDQV